MAKKICAVCGDSSAMNVRNAWECDDGNIYNICMACRESGEVNSETVKAHGWKSGAKTTMEEIKQENEKRERARKAREETMSSYIRKVQGTRFAK